MFYKKLYSCDTVTTNQQLNNIKYNENFQNTNTWPSVVRVEVTSIHYSLLGHFPSWLGKNRTTKQNNYNNNN